MAGDRRGVTPGAAKGTGEAGPRKRPRARAAAADQPALIEGSQDADRAAQGAAGKAPPHPAPDGPAPKVEADRPAKGRPPILFPLFAEISTLPGVGPRAAEGLEAMAVTRPRDLLLTLPAGGTQRRRLGRLVEARPPETVTVTVTATRHIPPTGRGRPWRVIASDGAQDLTLVFFHARDAWIAEQLPLGQRRTVSGKIELFDGLAQMVHPDHITREGAPPPAEFEPVYPLSGALTQKVMARAVAGALDRAPELPEWIDPGLIAREGWPGWRAALTAAHAPPDRAALMADHPARARLAYDELFAHQLTLALARRERRRAPGRVTAGDGRLRARATAALPWGLTGAQSRAVAEIAADMDSPQRMNRLLQGDVGAGKTLVAWLALLIAVEAGGQGVLMAPTEILARQHGAALSRWAEAAGVRLAVLTGRDGTRAREQVLADLEAGLIDVLVGTHAVFQEAVRFADLRLAVIDEQHRFGVAQRMALGAKGAVPPDVLVMTATPIPRSLALTQFGDMDLSVLDEKPPGRQPITTTIVAEERLDDVTTRLGEAIAAGRRAYWVCPLVEESETSDLTAAEERFRRLRARFGEAVRLIHGQMPAEARDAAMGDFAAGRASILVATTVIEVGVDVPEATIMVIERAESFGLAQLHQLRGRVGRGTGASSCLMLYRPPLGETALRRLSILRETEDGFRIAEEDLAIRGAGDAIGVAQSGLPRFRIADLERQGALMATACTDARALLERDPGLTSDRGKAARALLWLMEQDKAIRLIAAG